MNIIQECILKFWFRMWNLAVKQVGDNTFPYHVAQYYLMIFSLWANCEWYRCWNNQQCENPIHHQWSTSLASRPQESQVARSQIKHATEHRRPKSDLCLGGRFDAAEPHHHSQLNFLPLLPPLPATNGAVPTVSVYWHLCLLLSGCEITAMGKRWTNEGGTLRLVPWLATCYFSVHEYTKGYGPSNQM